MESEDDESRKSDRRKGEGSDMHEEPAPKKRGRPRKEGERDKSGRLKRKREKKKRAQQTNQQEGMPAIEEEEMGQRWEVDMGEMEQQRGDERGQEPREFARDRLPSNMEIMESLNSLHAALRGSIMEERQREQQPSMDPLERQKKIRLIQAYRTKLGKYLSDALKKQTASLEGKADEDIERLEKEVKYAVYAGTQPKLVEDLYFRILDYVEKPLGAEGLTEDVRDNPHLQDLLTEVSIKYQNYMEVEPEYRLAFMTLNNVISKRRMNREMKASHLSQPMDEELRGAFSRING